MSFPFFSLTDVQGVIFDWDGVIAETKLDFSPIRQKYFGGRRVPLLEAAEEMEEPMRSEFLNEIRDEEMRGARLSTPVDGTAELIGYLESRGIPWCIHSRNCRESVVAAAEAIGMTLPEHVITREAKHVKPDPQAMYDAAEAIGTEPRKCLVIGDFLYELLAARRAGMRCVLVRQNDAECVSYADGCFDTMPDLTKAFMQGGEIVPWEYQPVFKQYGAKELARLGQISVFFNKPLTTSSLEKLCELAGFGINSVIVEKERTVTADEIRNCILLSPRWLGTRIQFALTEFFSLRYPMLSVKEGRGGLPFSALTLTTVL